MTEKPQTTTVWILTKEINDYNQDGEYFVAVFGKKPTAEQLSKHNVGDTNHVLNGGGRKEYEDIWYMLEEKKVSYV